MQQLHHNLDPISLMINFNVGIVYMVAGNYDKELEYGRRLVELEPNFYGSHLLVGCSLIGLKKYEEAFPEIEIALHQNISSLTLRYMGLIYGLMGEKVKAQEVVEKMKDLVSTQWVGNYDIGVVYLALGEFDNAFQYFEKAIEKHEGFLLFWKYNFRYFPELKHDPRTEQFLEKIGTPYQW